MYYELGKVIELVVTEIKNATVQAGGEKTSIIIGSKQRNYNKN